MTLRDKQNHYNIKFLKGYGHSISVKDSKIILKDNHNPFSEPESEEWSVKNMPYEKIVLSDRKKETKMTFHEFVKHVQQVAGMLSVLSRIEHEMSLARFKAFEAAKKKLSDQ